MQLDLSIFNPKSRPLIGVDISSSAVKMVELSGNGKDGYRVERYAIEVLSKDVVTDGNISNLEEAAESLRRAWKRMGTSTRHVALALPATSVIMKKIFLPAWQREEEMEVMVESEANQYIPFPLEEVNLDFQVLGVAPSSPDDVEVLIAASRKEKVEDRVAVAEVAGLKPIVMDVEDLATLSAFELVASQLPDGGRDQIIALVDAGAFRTKLAVLRNGQQVYAKEQAFGGVQLTQEIARHYGMSYEEAEAAKRSNTLPDNFAAELLRPFMENLAIEISRALQFFFTSTQFSTIDRIVMTGGCSAIPGIDELIAEKTKVGTLIANPFAGMAVSSQVRARSLIGDSSALMVACGLALRRFDE